MLYFYNKSLKNGSVYVFNLIIVITPLSAHPTINQSHNPINLLMEIR